MDDDDDAAEAMRHRFENALETLVGKLKQDRTILAALLAGSLSYDAVWEKSDIDLLLITEEGEKRTTRMFCLVEDGINIHASLMPRGEFRRAIEGGLQSAFIQSMVSRSRMLFSRDDALAELYDGLNRVGARDRDMQRMRTANWLLATLAKAEKWYHVKRDNHYCFLWLLRCAEFLATIEVVSHGEVPGREVIHQALAHEPEFFRAIYTDLIDGPKDRAAMGAALDAINGYLDARTRTLFRPILEFLEDAGGARSTTEIDEHFKKRVQIESLAFIYEWLADKGVLTKVGVPLRLNEKSRVTVDEAAYLYNP